MKFPDRILFIGRAYSGKTSMARLFEPLGYAHINYADAVKREVADHLGISVQEVEARKGELRPMLQQWGTNYRRREDPDYWVRTRENYLLSRRAEAFADNPIKYAGKLDFPNVCSDGRFINEVLDFAARGGLVVKVILDEASRNERCKAATGRYPTAEERAHPSEAGIDDLPYHIPLSGSWREPGFVLMTIASCTDAMPTLAWPGGIAVIPDLIRTVR